MKRIAAMIPKNKIAETVSAKTVFSDDGPPESSARDLSLHSSNTSPCTPLPRGTTKGASSPVLEKGGCATDAPANWMPIDRCRKNGKSEGIARIRSCFLTFSMTAFSPSVVCSSPQKMAGPRPYFLQLRKNRNDFGCFRASSSA